MDYSRNRVLTLYRILQENTDEMHPLTMCEIQEYMAKEGQNCSQDSISRYIKQLRTELGVDVISSRGRNASYFIGARVLNKEEIQLLLDAINSSNVIGKGAARTLIKKLKSMVSRYEAEELNRIVLSSKNSAKENKRILYNISSIQMALDTNKQIEFEYMDWTVEKKMEKVGPIRTFNPWGLIWANERYYLYGYTIASLESIIEERTYRVDKINNIKILENSIRQGRDKFAEFDVREYVSRRIDMFSGKERFVTVKVPNNLIGAFIDKFGTNIIINPCGMNTSIVKFRVAVTKIFYGWLIGLENVELVEPKDVRDEMEAYLKQIIRKYE